MKGFKKVQLDSASLCCKSHPPLKQNIWKFYPQIQSTFMTVRWLI